MAPRTILLKGRGIRKEAVAGGAITPGHLVTLNSASKLIVHNVARGKAAACFAVENDLNGKGIDDAYANNDYVQAEYLMTGCEVYALVAANAAAIAVGDLLESAGDGTLRKFVGLTDNSGGTANTTLQAVSGTFQQAELANNFADIAAQLNNEKAGCIAQAIEAVDNSGGSSAARIKAVII